MPRVLVLTPLGLALLLLSAACDGSGDGDSAPTTTLATASRDTPVHTVTAQPGATSGPRWTQSNAPQAAEPEVPGGVTPLGYGMEDARLAGGEAYGIDSADLAANYFTACAALVVPFTWQVQDPHPPDGVMMKVTMTRMDTTEPLGEGPSGSVAVGCAFIEFTNESAFAVTVQVRYVIGEVGG